MNTTFKSTAEAAAHLADNPQTAQAVKEEVFWNEMVSALLSMRISKEMTQEQIAESMKCDASKISRLESGNDRQLKWSDIVGYANALNVQMSIFFDDETLPAAARIKQCVFRIDDDLKKLAHMAQQFDGDAKIAERIASFYQEVLFNFLKRFSENRERLSNFIRIQPKERAAVREESAFADNSELPSPPLAGRSSSPSQP
jgi:transcriptional regulator with XRE-family HTH domain